LRIETDHGAASPGEVGEIVVHGPTVTSGYVNSGEAVTAPIQDGWFHTGDLGCVDEEGYLYVVARRDDLIISGGENIYPAEVEAVLLSHPNVEEAAVTGIADARWGQVPVAAVKLRPDSTLTADELRAFCAARLGRYKVPVAFRFVDSLPRNAAGKLLRAALSENWSLDGTR
jgi:O-succinylbenzoic acid--CoA ligase